MDSIKIDAFDHAVTLTIDRQEALSALAPQFTIR